MSEVAEGRRAAAGEGATAHGGVGFFVVGLEGTHATAATTIATAVRCRCHLHAACAKVAAAAASVATAAVAVAAATAAADRFCASSLCSGRVRPGAGSGSCSR